MRTVTGTSSNKSSVPEAQEHFYKAMEFFESALGDEYEEEDEEECEGPNKPTVALDRAIQEFSEAIRLDPQFAAAYIKRGDTLLNITSPIAPWAETCLDPERASQLSDYFRESYSEQTAELLMLGFRGPVDDYTTAIKLDPNSDSAYIGRANAYQNAYNLMADTKYLEMAISDLSEAIRVNPGNVQAYWDRGLALEAASRAILFSQTYESRKPEYEEFKTKARSDFAKVKELGKELGIAVET